MAGGDAGPLERIAAGTSEGHDIDVDALNADLLAGMGGQPWDVPSADRLAALGDDTTG